MKVTLDKNTLIYAADVVGALVRLGEAGNAEEVLRRKALEVAQLAEEAPIAEPVAWRCVDLLLHKSAVVEITEDAELAMIRRTAFIDGLPCWKVTALYSAPQSARSEIATTKDKP